MESTRTSKLYFSYFPPGRNIILITTLSSHPFSLSLLPSFSLSLLPSPSLPPSLSLLSHPLLPFSLTCSLLTFSSPPPPLSLQPRSPRRAASGLRPPRQLSSG